MTKAEQISQIIRDHHQILIIQADNPDADSLASALALESIFHEMGKEPILYCSVDMPQYLKYLPGWDRVTNELPNQFDASIVVDTSSESLLEQLNQSGATNTLSKKPLIVLDHHTKVSDPISYASVILNDPNKVSTGELIYSLALDDSWPLTLPAIEYIMTSILSDSMGLATDNTTAETYRIMAELVDRGADRPKLEEQRRSYSKMAPIIFNYKGTLIQRTEFHHDGRLAYVSIPQPEINEYSPLYNPAPLIQGDHLQTEGVEISIVLKHYDSGRITAAIRCNHSAPIASELAETFGGGGHAYAAGFKQEQTDINIIKKACLQKASELLDQCGENLR